MPTALALGVGCGGTSGTTEPPTEESVGSAGEALGETFANCVPGQGTTGIGGWSASTGELVVDAHSSSSHVIILTGGSTAFPYIQVNGHTCESSAGVPIPLASVKGLTILGEVAGGDTVILDFSNGLPTAPLLAATTTTSTCPGTVATCAATGILVNGQLPSSGGAGAADTLVLKGSASADTFTVAQDVAYSTGPTQKLYVGLASAPAANIVLENLANTTAAAPNPSLFFMLNAGNDVFSAMGWSSAAVPVAFPVNVFGGPGNDTITGGMGNDVLNGGPGSDTFLSSTPGGDGADSINGGVAGVTADVDVVDYSARGTSAGVFGFVQGTPGVCSVVPTGVTFTGGGCVIKPVGTVSLPASGAAPVVTLTKTGSGCTSAPTVAFTGGTCATAPVWTSVVKTASSGVLVDVNSAYATVWSGDLFALQGSWLSGYGAAAAAPIDGKTLTLDVSGAAAAAVKTVTFAAAAGCSSSSPLTCAVTPGNVVAQINDQLNSAAGYGTSGVAYAKLVGSHLVIQSANPALHSAAHPYGYVNVTAGGTLNLAWLGLSVGSGPVSTGVAANGASPLGNDGEIAAGVSEGDDLQNINTVKGSALSELVAVTMTAGTCTVVPTIAFGGGCATEPTATLSVPSGGGVVSAALTAAGAGCSSAPTVSFTGGTCTVAPAATATLSAATPLSNVLVGSAWTNTLIGGPGNDTLNGGPTALDGVSALTLTAGGASCTAAPLVTFSGGGCTVEPTATATEAAGAVTGLTLVTSGFGCTSAPTVTIAGSSCAGATGTATVLAVKGGTSFLADYVSALTVTAAGSSCTGVPTVSFAGGCSIEPTATAVLNVAGTGVASITVNTPGSGCTSAPVVTVAGNSCAGVTASATVPTIDSTANCAADDADSLQGGAGNDWYDMGYAPACSPVITAGSGLNLVDYSKRVNPVTVNLDGSASSGEHPVAPGVAENAKIPNTVQIVLGGSGADIITVPTATTTSTYLFGGDEAASNPCNAAPTGCDVITGGGGNDYIWGGLGNDWMNGGAGNDTFFERSTYQVTGALLLGGTAAGDADPLATVASGYWDGIGSVVYGQLDTPGQGADLVNGGTGTQDRVDLSDTVPGAGMPIMVTICDDTSTAISTTSGSAWMTGCGNATANSNGAVYGRDDNDGIGTLGFVSVLQLTAGGGSCTAAPAVTFSAVCAVAPTATATEAAGAVTGLTLTSPGSGCTSAPVVTISGSSCAGVTATALMGITAGQANNYANVEWISGGKGTSGVLSNVIIGTAASEELEGGVGLDVILGQGGNDTIFGWATGGVDGSSVDILCGGDDGDTVTGGGAATVEGEGQMPVIAGLVPATHVLPSHAGLSTAASPDPQDPENCYGLQDTDSLDDNGQDFCSGGSTYYDCLNQVCVASVE